MAYDDDPWLHGSTFDTFVCFNQLIKFHSEPLVLLDVMKEVDMNNLFAWNIKEIIVNMIEVMLHRRKKVFFKSFVHIITGDKKLLVM